MCMKNVNMNCFACKSVMVENELLSFSGITDTLNGIYANGAIQVDSFNIVVFVNIIQAKNETELFTNYECSMRITSHAGKTTEIARFKLADNAQITLKEEGFVCRNFATNKFYIPLKEYSFPDGEGRYILKILIRKCEDSNDISNAKPENDTQFMMPLYIRNAEPKGCNE